MNKKWLPVLPPVLLTVVLVTAGVRAAPAADQSYIVQSGDTLYSIALRYSLDVQTLAAVNHIVNPNAIYVGQVLTIPQAAPAPAPPPDTSSGSAYIVRPGDTLYSIALRYGTDMWTLAAANGITDLSHIYIGQRLVIPGATPAPPASTPTSSPPPAPISLPGPWNGEYFTSRDLSGAPYVTRIDESVGFNWGWNAPVSGLPADDFSVRWSGTFGFAGAAYRFYAKVDDGVRLYVDDHLLIDGWRDGGYRLYTAEMTMTAGEHDIRVEYYDRVQVARIAVWWKQLELASAEGDGSDGEESSSTPTPVPGTWLAQIYDNQELSGEPTITRYDPFIGFDWGTSGPLPDHYDHFSIRWTTIAHFDADHYDFCAMADDGVRILVGDQQVLNEWHPDNGVVARCQTDWVGSGDRPVTVEYYEEGGNAMLYIWWDPR